MCRPPAISTANSEDGPPAMDQAQDTLCTTIGSPAVQDQVTGWMWSAASQSMRSHTHMAERCSMVVHVLSAVAGREQLDERLRHRRQHAIATYKERILCTSCGKDHTFPMQDPCGGSAQEWTHVAALQCS